MGDFDLIHVQFPMPDPEMQEEEFQFKNFGCIAAVFIITADGRLMCEGEDWEYHGDLTIYGRLPDPEKTFHTEFRVYRVRFTDGVCQWIRRIREEDMHKVWPAPPGWKGG